MVAVGAAAVLLILPLWWVIQGGPHGALINIERQQPLQSTFKVDLNTASWPELAQLPNVGELLAREIVDSRTKQGPYRTAEDLLRVHGIGPQRLEGIRGYLLPLPGESMVGEH